MGQDDFQTGWLIEKLGMPLWLTTRDGHLEWTASSLDAMRFSRKVDAERVLSLHPELVGIVTEHEWFDNNRPEQPEAGK